MHLGICKCICISFVFVGENDGESRKKMFYSIFRLKEDAKEESMELECKEKDEE